MNHSFTYSLIPINNDQLENAFNFAVMKMQQEKAVFNWSGGKDATLALALILKNDSIKIDRLITTINGNLQRVTMHGVPVSLMEKQANSLDIPLSFLELPEDISMTRYSEITQELAQTHKNQGISKYIYGDIFLEDLKQFRDKELAINQIEGIYPLWKKNTSELAKYFIDEGYKAIVVATNSKLLNENFVGKYFDHSFLAMLPEGVDPCGENGEFHTFVYDGPIFKEPIPFTKGKPTYKTYSPKAEDDDCFCCDSEEDKTWDKGFWFCELLD